MISFDNTEIAFASKSNKDLKRAYKLFKMVGNPGLVKFGNWATDFALKIGLPISGIVKKTIFKQFCGGEDIEECNGTIKELDKYGVGTILDYSVEGNTSKTDFTDTVNELIATIEKGKNEKAIPFAVFKVTGIANFHLLERINDENAQLSATDVKLKEEAIARVDQICSKAFEYGVPVFIDAEETWIQDGIDRITNLMMEKYNKERAIIFNTLQMYRHDRLAYLKQEVAIAKEKGYNYGVKLVRGAYMEKERARAQEKGYASPIQPNKAASDRDYDLGLAFLLDHIDNIALCAGTHNEKSSQYLAELIEQKGIDKTNNRLYFAQLLGMSDHISYNLSNAGYNVAKYVPYGPVKEVLPYLIRRANENTSVAGQTSRELGLIIKEKKRRKL